MHGFEPWKRDSDRIVLCDWDEVRALDVESALTSGDGPIFGSVPRPLIQITTDVFERLDGPVVDDCDMQLCECPGCGKVVYFQENCGNGEPKCSRLPKPLTHADLLRDLFTLMDQCPNLDFELTTEWPELIRPEWTLCPACQSMYEPQCTTVLCNRPNVYLGIRAQDQESCNKRIPELLKCSDLCASLAAQLELTNEVDVVSWIGGVSYHCDRCDHWHREENDMVFMGGDCWYCEKCNKRLSPGSTLSRVKVGGQTGPDGAPCNVDWIRSVKEQCEAAGVPCEVTQLGSCILQVGCNDIDWPEARFEQ